MDWSKWKKLFSHISVEEIVPALLVLVVGLIVIKLLLKLLDTTLRRSNLEKTAYTLLRSFLKILLLVVLVLILCSMLGVNVTSLVALLSVVTLAISLSVQNLLTNVISGIILLGSKPFKVGDFVELKNSNIDDGTKISHLTYIGDSEVGKRVNFGCGTVTCNYDGKKKYRTTIGDDCFVGCTTNFVSPINVGDGVYIAAGSTITEDIPENSLSIARARQVNKEGWKDKRK